MRSHLGYRRSKLYFGRGAKGVKGVSALRVGVEPPRTEAHDSRRSRNRNMTADVGRGPSWIVSIDQYSRSHQRAKELILPPVLRRLDYIKQNS